MNDFNPLEWINGSDTGISSKTIWSVMMCAPMRGADIPHDPDDFGRCYRLLKSRPEWRDRLAEVADIYPKWGPMVEAWSELERLWEQESPTGKCPKLYDRMQELIDAGMVADGWVQTYPGCWRKEE